MFLGLLGWVVIGVVVGLIVSKLLNLHGDDPRLGLAAAAVGAIAFATGYTVISGDGVSAFNVWSMVFAAIGACVALGIWHGVRSRYVSRAPVTHRRSY